MAEDGEASNYLHLSQEYIAAARDLAREGTLAPARFSTIHALELSVKAVLTARDGAAPKLHHVGGEFGRRFRGDVGADVVRRINRLLDDYNGPRYPGWKIPSTATIVSDIEFVEQFVREIAPRLMEADR